MASDNKASYSVIGFTVLAALAAITATVIYLGGISDDRDSVFVETYCEKSVSGLSVGSAVNFRGVQIGKVREISFAMNHYQAMIGQGASPIRIVMAIDGKLVGGECSNAVRRHEIISGLVDAGLRAMVTASGITGISRIEFDVYPDEPKPAALTWRPDHLYIPSKVSLLDSFSDSATKVMNQINRMDLETAWSNINSSIESLARATDGIKTLVETSQSDIERLVDDAGETVSSLKKTAAELKRNPSLLIRDRRPEPLPETE